MRRPDTTWATVQFDEMFTGAAGAYPSSAWTKSYGSPNVPYGSFGIVVPESGYYVCQVRGYVNNIAAGARATAGMQLNGTLWVTAEMYVVNVGGQDQSSVHGVYKLTKGDRLTAYRYHSDGGSSRLVSTELTIEKKGS